MFDILQNYYCVCVRPFIFVVLKLAESLVQTWGQLGKIAKVSEIGYLHVNRSGHWLHQPSKSFKPKMWNTSGMSFFQTVWICSCILHCWFSCWQHLYPPTVPSLLTLFLICCSGSMYYLKVEIRAFISTSRKIHSMLKFLDGFAVLQVVGLP